MHTRVVCLNIGFSVVIGRFILYIMWWKKNMKHSVLIQIADFSLRFLKTVDRIWKKGLHCSPHYLTTSTFSLCLSMLLSSKRILLYETGMMTLWNLKLTWDSTNLIQAGYSCYSEKLDESTLIFFLIENAFWKIECFFYVFLYCCSVFFKPIICACRKMVYFII